VSIVGWRPRLVSAALLVAVAAGSSAALSTDAASAASFVDRESVGSGARARGAPAEGLLVGDVLVAVLDIYPSNQDSIVVSNTVAASGYSGIVLGGGSVTRITVRNNVFAFNDQWGIARDASCPTATVADTNVLFANPSAPSRVAAEVSTPRAATARRARCS
jgi:hypothetical protein